MGPALQAGARAAGLEVMYYIVHKRGHSAPRAGRGPRLAWRAGRCGLAWMAWARRVLHAVAAGLARSDAPCTEPIELPRIWLEKVRSCSP